MELRNYRSAPMEAEAALVLPPGWRASRETVKFTVAPNTEGRDGFTVTISEAWDRSRPRLAIAADVMVEGQYLGQIAEAVVDVQFLV